MKNPGLPTVPGNAGMSQVEEVLSSSVGSTGSAASLVEGVEMGIVIPVRGGLAGMFVRRELFWLAIVSVLDESSVGVCPLSQLFRLQRH